MDLRELRHYGVGQHFMLAFYEGKDLLAGRDVAESDELRLPERFWRRHGLEGVVKLRLHDKNRRADCR